MAAQPPAEPAGCSGRLGVPPCSRSNLRGRARARTDNLELTLILSTLEIIDDPIKVMPELGGVRCTRAANLFDDGITHGSLLLEKFLWGAEYGRFVSKAADDLLNPRPHPGVSDMPTVPSHQVLHPVHGGERDVEGITRGLRR